MKRNTFVLTLMLMASLPWGLQAQHLWSNVIAPSRAIDWTSAGVVGGIPSGSWPSCTSAQAGTTVPIPAYGTAAAPGSPATINSAITACATANPSGSVLQLAAGTFYLSPTINFGTSSNVALRGQGANQTTIWPIEPIDGCGGQWGIICVQGGNAYVQYNSPGTEQNVCDWTSGYAPGSTTITLANCGTTPPGVGSLSNLKIGSLLVLDQLSEQTDTGTIWNCTAVNVCSAEGSNYRADGTCSPSTWCERDQEQVVEVTNCTNTAGVCTSSANLTISPPIYMPNWSSAKLPQAWYANYYLQNDGIENLTVTTGDTGGVLSSNGTHTPSIVLYDCLNCWVKGVGSWWADRDHVLLDQCEHCEVRDSYLFQNEGHYTQSYAIETYTSGDVRIENNICQGITDSCPTNTFGGEGTVVTYNYAPRTNYTPTNQYMQNAIFLHNAGDAFNLYEGNIGNGFNSDDVHGTHHFHTIFRNLMTGWQTDCNGAACVLNTFALKLEVGSRYYNFIGNVTGTAGAPSQSIFECIAPAGLPGQSQNCTWDTSILVLGYANSNTEGAFCATPACSSTVVGWDPETLDYLMRWGNYDTVTGVVHWCGNSSDTGWTSTCASTTEIPAQNFSPYTQPVPTLGDTGAGQGALPKSFAYSSAPSWWGSLPWPAIGPDVTGGSVGVCASGSFAMLPATNASQCMTGSLSTGWAGHVNMNPAMNCYLNVMNGPVDGEYPGTNSTGTPLSFNAATCYGGASGTGTGGAPPAPAPPTFSQVR